MTYLKTLIALTTLALLTACGGATPTATGDPAQTTDCEANPFAASCIAEDIAAPMRLTACLADITTNPLCTGDAGIATVFCEENPFDTRPACTADDYADERLTACTGDITTLRCMPLVTPVCEANNGFNNPVCRGIAKYDQQRRCANGACVDFADLPTLPTAPVEQATPTIDFADGALSVTLIAPADGTLILNPDGNGAENTTIDPAPFNTGGTTGTVVREGSVTFRRRGGRGSSDADGFVIFELAKANDDDSVMETNRASLHSAILPTTNLGAPLTDAPATAVWPGHYYTEVIVYPTDFYITFEAGLANNQIGRIGLANLAKDGIGTIDADKPEFARGTFGARFAVTFDADGVLSGTIASGFFTNSVLGLIGTEGVVAVAATGSGTAGFTATNPNGGATAIVIDPCIGGLAACYGTYEFWRSNARNSNNTIFQLVRPASEASPADDPRFSFVMGGASTLDIPTFADTNNIRSAGLTLSALADSTDSTSGFAARYIRTSDTTYTYAGLLSGTNVGAPFTDANQPAAEWTAIAQMTNSMPTPPFTLDVVFTGGAGTIKTKSGESIMLPDDNDSVADNTIAIDGQFGSNGVIYGNVVLNSDTAFITNAPLTLSGLIGANGAVGVFGGVDGSAFAGGFVARPNPASGG